MLYATGLERDRKQLMALVQIATGELARLHERDDMPVSAAKTIEQLLTILSNHSLTQ